MVERSSRSTTAVVVVKGKEKKTVLVDVCYVHVLSRRPSSSGKRGGKEGMLKTKGWQA